MKTFTTIAKVLAALAAVAGVVYVIATYGDKIVAWAKKLLRRNKSSYWDDDCEDCEFNDDGECLCDCDCEGCDDCDDVTEAEVGDKDFQ